MSHVRPLSLAVTAALALAACSDDSSTDGTGDAGASVPTTDGASIPDVDGALADFPPGLLPLFALDDSGIAPEEIYRRIDYVGGRPGETSWGVEGVADDDTGEREVRYATDAAVIEAIDGQLVDELPPAAAATLASLYPDASIEEIERTDDAGTIAYAVLLDVDGSEVEPNLDEAGTLLSLEEEIEASELPAAVAAVVDAEAGASAAGLPGSGLERETLASGEVRYSVEYENDDGQSLTLAMTETGELLVVEHEDSLERLSTSDTPAEALEGFPDGIEADFAASFPEVAAAEAYRNIDVAGGGTVTWGIEGASDDESLELSALYDEDGQRLEQERERLLDAAPEPVATAFEAAYPGAEIDEIVEVESDEGTAYEIVFASAEGEEDLAANYDAAGGFMSLERVLDAEDVPQAVLDALGAERVLLPVLEIERVEAADGTVAYEAEYESASEDEDERSISYALDADGTIGSIEHEALLPL